MPITLSGYGRVSRTGSDVREVWQPCPVMTDEQKLHNLLE
jgi:hypothetical protein